MILVTGATGFIGRVVCRALATTGYRVRAGCRQPALPTELSANGVITAQVLDLDRPEGLPAALAGVDAIVHAAYGRVEAMPAQLDGLLRAAERAGVGRIVHFSSIAVYGNATGRVDETRSPERPIGAYGRAKIRCEERLRAWAQPGRCAIALRPGIVYGPGSPFWNEKIERRIRAGIWGTFGRQGEGTAALVHVEDVARSVVAALSASPARPWLAVNITGPDSPTWNAYFTAMAETLGVTLREITPAMLKGHAAGGLLARTWRRTHLPGLKRWALAALPGELALFARRANYPNDLARHMLDWSPTADFRVELKAIHGARMDAPSIVRNGDPATRAGGPRRRGD